MALNFACAKFRNDKEFILAAVKSEAGAIKFAHPVLRHTRRFVFECIQQNPFVLAHVECEFREDREVIMAAIKGNGATLEFAPRDMREEWDVVAEAVQTSNEASKLAAPWLY